MKTLLLTFAVFGLDAWAQASDAPSTTPPPLIPLIDAASAPATTPSVEPTASPEPPPRFSGWHAAGVWGGASFGATFGAFSYALTAYALPHSRVSSCPGSGCAIAAFGGMAVGLVGGGLLGYLLGGAANEGRLWARVLTIALDVIGLPATGFAMLGAVAATGNFPGGG